MQNLTHTFKLPSGVECEVKEMTGEAQRLLTQQDKTKSMDKFNRLLKSLIVRVGSVTEIDDKFIEGMLDCDTKMALVEIRQFSLDEKAVEFTYNYVDIDGNSKQVKEHIDLPDGKFPFTPMHVKNDKGEMVPAAYKEYADIQREVKIVLPRTKKKVTFTLLDGKGSSIGAATGKKHRSSHTMLKMRRPVEDSNGTPISLDLDKLPLKDIEYLRTQIKAYEGRVDTEVRFEHPDAEFLPANERYVVEDLLAMEAFFFPSEAIS